MAINIDINCDMGESYGRFTIGNDEAIMPYISSCNIACGFHGGDPTTILKTIDMAIEHGTSIGAHPGYPDLMGFGRRSMALTPQELRDILIYQIGALKSITESRGARLHHVKVHGALYHDAHHNPEVAAAVIDAIVMIDPSILIYTFSQGELHTQARHRQLNIWTEAFADRAYTSSGWLKKRKMKGAVISDPILASEQAWKIAYENKVDADNGAEISIQADTICVHGDTENAVDIAMSIHNKLNHNS